MRTALVVYGGALVCAVLFGLAHEILIGSIKKGATFASISGWLDLLSYGTDLLGAAQVGALVALGRGLSDARARSRASQAAGLAGATLLVALAQQVGLRTLLPSLGHESFDLVLRALRTITSLLGGGATAALLLGLVWIGRAGGVTRLVPVAQVAGALLALRILLVLTSVVFGRLPEWAGTVHQGLYWGLDALLLGALALAWVAAGRAPEVALPPPAAGDTPLDRGWESVFGALGTYLGAAGARVALALLSWLVMLGARDAKDVSDLAGVRTGVVFLAILSGLAALAMLAGVYRLSSAPAERARGPAGLAVAAMATGLLLDVASTIITAQALGGDVSAAFFAMKALPILGALGLALGVGAGIALLRTLGALAEALALTEAAERAAGTAPLLAVTGLVGSAALLLASKAPSGLVLVLALILLPLAIAVLVQFLRVAFALRAALRSRLWAPSP